MPSEPVTTQPPKRADAPPASLATFLQEGTPGHEQEVAVTVEWDRGTWDLQWPRLSLYCESETCEDTCFFDPDTKQISLDSKVEGTPLSRLGFAIYTCRHCKRTKKVFALRLITTGGNVQALRAMKFGEDPPAVGPTPRSLKALLGDQWNLFLQGRRSELAGLGIGAFVYYRRAVENVWQTVLARLIEVARIDGAAERLELLTRAQQENRFTRSMEAAKGAVPPSLYVDNNNPFQALYDAYGDGLHEYSDEECIARSRVIRLVLARFAERTKGVLSEDREFRQAIGSGLASRTGVMSAPTGAASTASPAATKSPSP
jgi:hypothetical protein